MKTIDVHIPYEDIISRIPGLFAVIENGRKVSAAKYQDGCYGHIVADIKLPKKPEKPELPENPEVPENVMLVVNGIKILKEGEIYTYKTIMMYYYQYKELLPKDDVFIKFVENGIGKVYINIDNAPLAPDYIYMSQVDGWLKKLNLLKTQCVYYQKLRNEKKNDEHLCCLCDYYANIGGNTLLDKLEKIRNNRAVVAKRYFGYAQDNTHIELNIDLETTHKDLGVTTPNVELWSPYKTYREGDEVFYDGKLYVANKEESKGEWDEELEINKFSKTEWKVKKPIFQITKKPEEKEANKTEEKETNKLEDITSVTIEGKTDSKLKDLRRSVTYVNEQDIPEKPLGYKDWLFYYRVGVVRNVSARTDDDGNIVTIDGRTAIGDKDKDKLLAYGDIIADIKAKKSEKTITFVYLLGVHLTATYAEKIKKNGKTLHTWQNFKARMVDEKYDGGIRYEETYTYFAGSELDKLINGKFGVDEKSTKESNYTFKEYTEGKYDNAFDVFRFEFDTSSNKSSYEQKIYNKTFTSTANISNFTLQRNGWNDFDGCGVIRLDYLSGITYAPTKEIDVQIQRGSTSAFEQHIAFGEIKTFEDLENHSGSYFTVTEG